MKIWRSIYIFISSMLLSYGGLELTAFVIEFTDSIILLAITIFFVTFAIVFHFFDVNNL